MSAELSAFLREELGVAGEAREWHVAAPLWQWQPKKADGATSAFAWYLVTIDGEVADAIRLATTRKAAWGSVYVTVTVGATTWATSIFPSKDVRGYLLPVKAAVRKAEKLVPGDVVEIVLAV
jgi:Domain of unknown function (DUF1905)